MSMRRVRFVAAALVVGILLVVFRGNAVLLAAAAVLKLAPSAGVHGPFGFYKGPNHSIDGTAGHGAYRVTYEDGVPEARNDGRTFVRQGPCWAPAVLPPEDYADLDGMSAVVLDNALGPVTVDLNSRGLVVIGLSAGVTITRQWIEISSVRAPNGFALEYTPALASVPAPTPLC